MEEEERHHHDVVGTQGVSALLEEDAFMSNMLCYVNAANNGTLVVAAGDLQSSNFCGDHGLNNADMMSRPPH